MYNLETALTQLKNNNVSFYQQNNILEKLIEKLTGEGKDKIEKKENDEEIITNYYGGILNEVGETISIQSNNLNKLIKLINTLQECIIQNKDAKISSGKVYKSNNNIR